MKYRHARLLSIAAAAILLGLAGCAHNPLPQRGSPAELIYAGRCGSCHKPYQPSSMTSAMWAQQVESMQIKMAQAGVAPLSPEERREILNYLERNAGTE